MNETAATIPLSDDSFLSSLNQFSNSNKFWVACSGGLDSSVLLHLFSINKNKIKQDIEVLYVNHGLQEEAGDWGLFCKKLCQQYDIAYTQLEIKENYPKGVSVEAWAREKRYSLIENLMGDHDVLFTAHHLDDQVETFFLQALRGAGPRGLASMPIVKNYSNALHARPLLNYSRENLKEYAEENKLDWHEDKSNMDYRYDRNYLRHRVMPVIEDKWPSYRQTISRLISHQKESKKILDEIACADLEQALHNNIMCLNLNYINELSIERQKNLIFFWLNELSLDSPGSINIEQVISNIIYSNTEKAPCVNWKNTEIRRYKNMLYASKKIEKHDVDAEYYWKPERVLNILDETLIAKSRCGKGISKTKTNGADFVVRYRHGGEKIQPDYLSHSKTVKQLFQEKAVLPWLRDRIPLVYINGKLAVIPGFCIDESFSADEDEQSWDICWSGYENVIQQ